MAFNNNNNNTSYFYHLLLFFSTFVFSITYLLYLSNREQKTSVYLTFGTKL